MTTSKFKISNKVLSVLLCVVMLFSCVLFSAPAVMAEEGFVTGSDGNKYNAADVAIINEIIGHSETLKEKYALNDPVGWSSGGYNFVSWTRNDDTPRRVSSLDFIWDTTDFKGALDVSGLTALEAVFCGTNPGITAIKLPPSVTHLNCSQAGITEIDVSKNTKLQEFYVYETGITKLDVSKNTELANLKFYNTQITEKIDLSGNSKLVHVIFGNTSDCVVMPNGYTVTIRQPTQGYLHGYMVSDNKVSFDIPEGYRVARWEGLPEGASAGDTEATFTLTGDVTVSAELVPEPRTLLTNLAIEGVTLSPSFQPDVFAYTATVGNDVSEINIVAEAEEGEDRSVTGAGKYTLQVGENTFTIKRTVPGREKADMGPGEVYNPEWVITREYTVTVIREAAQTDDTPPADDNPPADNIPPGGR